MISAIMNKKEVMKQSHRKKNNNANQFRQSIAVYRLQYKTILMTIANNIKIKSEASKTSERKSKENTYEY